MYGSRPTCPENTSEKVVEAVENDQRELFYPPLVRMLRVVNGISPRLGDLVLRRFLGSSVAPR